ITGAVKKPGVYKFPEGSRIFEVIEAAGGFTPKADIAALNLAETFTDAQHIHIPLKGERNRIAQTQNANNADTYTHITVQPQESKSNAKSSGKTGLVDVNNASESELQKLTGVGPAIAKRIYEYRQKNGRFKSAEELIHVRGIGPAKLEKMRSQILIR
ncbi:MAG: helix-hairpin-helix domain-containing protein, partial [Synergistaceae bacterium]|nr:helix-hairpin-helix domain-containing protein [Synergistaceae bacterium]